MADFWTAPPASLCFSPFFPSHGHSDDSLRVLLPRFLRPTSLRRPLCIASSPPGPHKSSVWGCNFSQRTSTGTLKKTRFLGVSLPNTRRAGGQPFKLSSAAACNSMYHSHCKCNDQFTATIAYIPCTCPTSQLYLFNSYRHVLPWYTVEV